jgi:DNA-binding PadR family transcriptional regulator
MRVSPLGEFEQLVLLATLQLKDNARAIDIRAQLADKAGRSVSRGALYSTLDRLEQKGYVAWKVEDATPERGGLPRRCFKVTDSGLEAVRRSLAAIAQLSKGFEAELAK